MGDLDDILSNGNAKNAEYEDVPTSDSLSSIDSLLNQKSHILRVKLEVLAAEIFVRFHLRGENLERISEDQNKAREMLDMLARAADYGWRDHGDKKFFYELQFGLEKQKREQEVECWRDIVLVMRDFLEVWEAHEQAKARSVFLKDAGG